jgi:hypothetical protein
MKKKLIILLFFSTILYSQSYSEKGLITITDTTFLFSIKDSLEINIHYKIQENEIEEITTNSIIISDLNDNIIQTIYDTTKYLGQRKRDFIQSASLFKIIDINFDGFNDFRIIENAGGGYLIPSFHYFLFNQNKNKFDYSEEFSKLCCNLSINKVLKEIYLEYYQTNEEKWTKWTYRIVDKIPKLSAIRTEYIFDEDNKQKFRTILEELIDGKMEVIMDTTVWKGM